MATIDCDVPVDLNLDEMCARAPDVEASATCSPSWSSLPRRKRRSVVEVTEAHYTEAASAMSEAVLKGLTIQSSGSSD